MQDHIRQNRSAYDALATNYDREVFSRPFQQNWDEKARALLKKYVPVVDSSLGIRAIDLGCGTGIYTKVLLEKNYHTTGVDISPHMIQAMKDKLSGYGDQLIPMVSDVLHLDVPGQQFEVATSFGALINHIEDDHWDTFLAKTRGLLVQDGLFLFDVEHIFGIDYFFYTLYSYLLRDPERPPLKELIGCLKSLATSRAYTQSLLWEFKPLDVHLRLTYRPFRIVRTLLKRNGFQIIHLDGTNIFSSIHPEVALSAYKPVHSNETQSIFLRMLKHLDTKAGGLLHSIAGVQFVVARKI